MKKIPQIKKSTSQQNINTVSKTESQKVPYRVIIIVYNIYNY